LFRRFPFEKGGKQKIVSVELRKEGKNVTDTIDFVGR